MQRVALVLTFLACASQGEKVQAVQKEREEAICSEKATVLITSHRNQQLTDNKGEVGTSPNADAWEMWTITQAGNGTVFITSHRNQQLTDNKGKVGTSPNADAWEMWTITQAGDGKVFITSHRNQELTDNKGKVGTSPNADAWEMWTITMLSGENLAHCFQATTTTTNTHATYKTSTNSFCRPASVISEFRSMSDCETSCSDNPACVACFKGTSDSMYCGGRVIYRSVSRCSEWPTSCSHYIKRKVWPIRIHTCDISDAGTHSHILGRVSNDVLQSYWHWIGRDDHGRNQWEEWLAFFSPNKIELKNTGSDAWCIDAIEVNGNRITSDLPIWLDDPCTSSLYNGDIPCVTSWFWHVPVQACPQWVRLPGQYLGRPLDANTCRSEADAKAICLQTQGCGGINKQFDQCSGTGWTIRGGTEGLTATGYDASNLESMKLDRSCEGEYHKTHGACRINGDVHRVTDETKICGGGHTEDSCRSTCNGQQSCSGFSLTKDGSCCVTFTTTEPVRGTSDILAWDCWVKQQADLFHVESGSCRVVDGGTCYQSTNYPRNYPDNDQCRARATRDEYVHAVKFQTESGFDHLYIGGHSYMGAYGPNYVYVPHNALIRWQSDYSGHEGAWKICASPATTLAPTPAPTPVPTPAPTSAIPHQCASRGPRQCAHLASFSLLDEVAAFRNDQEAQACMNSGMAAVTREVSHTCTLSQVQGSPPCGTECWPILKPKILSVQSWCLEKKYSGLERYNKCILEHGCDKPLAVECRDTNHYHTDSGGYPCYRYPGHESWCGHYDTPYFHSNSMCCACGGGDWACPDQSAPDVMEVRGASDVMEGYLANISVQLSQTAPESPIPTTHVKNEMLLLTLAFTSGALTAIMVGVITMRRLKGRRSSAAGHLLA